MMDEVVELDDPTTATLTLLSVEDDGTPASVNLRGNLITVGRAVTNKFVLDSLQISRHHASLEYRGDKWFIQDKSTNGILINHRRYPKHDWLELQTSDTIQFIPTGALQYRFSYTVQPCSRTVINSTSLQTNQLDGASSSRSTRGSPSNVDFDSEMDESSNQSISLLSGGALSALFDADGEFLPDSPMPQAAPAKKRQGDFMDQSPLESDKKRKFDNVPSDGEEEELLDLDEDESSFMRIVNAIQEQNESPSAATGHFRESIIKSPIKSQLKSTDPHTRIEQLEIEVDYMTNKCRRLQTELEDKFAEKISYEKIIDEVRSQGENYKHEFHKKMIELLEQDFSCSICSEVFIQATVTDCGHTFCSYCIEEWTRKKAECPICRKLITNQSKHVEIENYLTKVHGFMSEEVQTKRAQAVRERGDQAAKKESERSRRRNVQEISFAPDRFVDFLAELQHINDMFGGAHRGQAFGENPNIGGLTAASQRNAIAAAASVRRRSTRATRTPRAGNEAVVPTPSPRSMRLAAAAANFNIPDPPRPRGRPRTNRGMAVHVSPVMNLEPEHPVITLDDTFDEGVLPQPMEPQAGPSRLLNC